MLRGTREHVSVLKSSLMQYLIARMMEIGDGRSNNSSGLRRLAMVTLIQSRYFVVERSI